MLFVLGLALYGQSIVSHYLVLAFEAAREAERRLLRVEVARARGRAAGAACAAQSALPLQQPELDQRACRHGPGGRAAHVRAARRLPAHAAWPSARGRASRSGRSWRLAERYLAIEQVRFGERLAVERRVGPRGRSLPRAAAARCSRSSRTRSSTVWPLASTAAPCASARVARMGASRSPSRTRSTRTPSRLRRARRRPRERQAPHRDARPGRGRHGRLAGERDVPSDVAPPGARGRRCQLRHRACAS